MIRIPVKLNRFVNIAHRGASGHAPENSLAAFELALLQQADFVELDVRRTLDGEMVAFHDANLERTTNGTGALSARDLADLHRLDAGTWFNQRFPDRARERYAGLRIATLADVIAAVDASAGLYIEAKDPWDQPGIEDDLVDHLEAAGLLACQHVVLQAFAPSSLHAYAVRAPTTPRVQLVEYVCADGGLVERNGVTPPPGAMTGSDFARIAASAQGIGTNWLAEGRAGEAPVFPDTAYVDAAHAAGLFVHVWTVDDPAAMQCLIARGVDGIFTNFPDRLAALRHG